MQELGENGLAIVSLTAESDKDPLAFLFKGAPKDACGRVGKYVVKAGRAAECEVDMGYGPATWYRNPFLKQVARRLRPITPDAFAADCDPDLHPLPHVRPRRRPVRPAPARVVRVGVFFRGFDHAAEHPSDLAAHLAGGFVLVLVDVVAVPREVEGRVGLAVFPESASFEMNEAGYGSRSSQATDTTGIVYHPGHV